MNCYNFILFLLFTASCAPADPPSAGHLVHLRKALHVRARPGARTTIDLSFEVAAGYHIMADHSEQEQLILTSLHWADQKGIYFDQPLFPPAADFSLAGSEVRFPVFEKQFEIKVPVAFSSDLARGRYALQARLRYQACDDKKCYFPKELPVDVTLHIR